MAPAPERYCKSLIHKHLQFSMTRMTHMTHAEGGSCARSLSFDANGWWVAGGAWWVVGGGWWDFIPATRVRTDGTGGGWGDFVPDNPSRTDYRRSACGGLPIEDPPAADFISSYRLEHSAPSSLPTHAAGKQRS
jgi:hypothetical protein